MNSKNAALKLKLGDIQGRTVFPIDKELTIGRDASNDIVIPNLNVSRSHAKVLRDAAGEYWVKDLGSHNGTLLNGRLARKEKLQNEDIICVADVDMVFVLDAGEIPVGEQPAAESAADPGSIASDSTSFIDLSQLKKEEMEELRKNKPRITNPWKE
jgi:pSer/pThr/pTyr-binding forkhead associated (FHA) protein